MEDDHPLRILFVEDVPADAELAARVIRKEGLAFTSTCVETQDEFIAALDEFRPDVIVSDYTMPQFDGMRALKISLERDPTLPFIILTGTLNEETAVICIKTGATDYVIKDRITRLPFAVKEALAQRKTLKAKEATEQALRASEAQYRLLAENMSDTVWLMGLNLRTIYISPSVIRTRGFTLDEINALPLDRQLTPDSLTRAMELFAEALSPENLGRPDPRTIYSVELEFYRKDGSTFWSENTFALILDQNKQPANILSTGRDITESKRAEAALRESEARFRVIFERANDAIHVDNADDQILQVNPRMGELMGYSREELLTMRVSDLQAPEVRGQSGNVVRNELARHGHVAFESLNLHRSGRRIPIEVSVACIESAQGDLYVSIVRDITERKQAEAERERLLAQVQAQAEQIAQIMDTVPEGVLLLDADGQVLLANPAGVRDLVTLAGAAVGERLTHLGDLPLAELFAAAERGGPWHEVRVGRHIFEAIARSVSANSPAAGHWVLVINDVTQARDLRDQLQQQERLAAVGQLAAGIAHDFNNILAIIALQAPLIARAPGLAERERERLAIISEQTSHATRLIQQLLDFSRRAVLERRPLDLGPLLKEQVKLLARTLPESIEVTLVCEPGEYVVLADPTRLQQMLMNLAVNARDAMPAGGTLRL
ncbi:MAG: PAS domain S-box protein, partial [Anaerolineae bacterium]